MQIMQFFLQQQQSIKKIMQKALFLGRTDKAKKLRLKIQNERSKFIKEDEQNQAPLFNFTYAPSQKCILRKIPGFSQQKSKRLSKERVKFKLDQSKTLNDNEQGQKRRIRVRTKTAKQPPCKILKSFSTSKVIPLPKTEKLIQESTQETLQQKNEWLLAGQIIESLKNKTFLQQTFSLNYCIKRVDLLHLIVYIITHTLANNKKWKESTNHKYSRFSFLSQILSSFENYQKIQGNKIFQLKQNIFQFNYKQQDYNQQVEEKNNKLAKILHQLQNIREEYCKLQQVKNQLLNNSQSMKQSILSYQQKKQQLQLRIKQQKLAALKLEEDIKERMATLAETESIVNYLGPEKDATINKVSEEYKTIQAQMRDYAVKLQSNQMASKIDYEPKPFTQLEEVIMDEMNRTNRTIIQNIQILPELKEQLMRNFIIRTMDKFKQKDKQMVKLNEFKTNCIRNFIDNMKKWLDNYTLKSEYLGNMRKQFFFDSIRLHDKLQKLIPNCKSKHEKQLTCQIKELTKRLVDNYKLTSSFY